MLLPIVVFLFVAGTVIGGYAALIYLPGAVAGRRLDRRLREVSMDGARADRSTDVTIVKRTVEGPLPGVDRLMSGTRAGSRLARLIEQSGTVRDGHQIQRVAPAIRKTVNVGDVPPSCFRSSEPRTTTNLLPNVTPTVHGD